MVKEDASISLAAVAKNDPVLAGLVGDLQNGPEEGRDKPILAILRHGLRNQSGLLDPADDSISKKSCFSICSRTWVHVDEYRHCPACERCGLFNEMTHCNKCRYCTRPVANSRPLFRYNSRNKPYNYA